MDLKGWWKRKGPSILQKNAESSEDETKGDLTDESDNLSAIQNKI